MNDVLTIIPAKGRSTRLPNKNIALLDGKPLVVHAIEQAVSSGVCGEICVGTDSTKTAKIAKNAGASVPFLRDNDVDDITPVGVAALNILKRYQTDLKKRFKYLCLLLVTSPMRSPEDIIACRDLLFSNSNLDAAMSVVYAEKHPCWAWKIDQLKQITPMFPDKCDLGRNQLPAPFYVDGSVYWAKTAFFEKAKGSQYAGKVAGYIMPPERAIDIDTPLDLDFCEYLTSKKNQCEVSMKNNQNKQNKKLSGQDKMTPTGSY